MRAVPGFTAVTPLQPPAFAGRSDREAQSATPADRVVPQQDDTVGWTPEGDRAGVACRRRICIPTKWCWDLLLHRWEPSGIQCICLP